MDEREESDTVPLLLSQRIFEHIQSHYNDYDKLMAQDVLKLLESIVECLVLLIDLDNEDDIFIAVKDLIFLAIERDLEMRRVRVKSQPPILIEESQLRYLVDNGFKTKDIASIHGCSRRTIERRMKKFDMCHEFTDMSDADLDFAVQELLFMFPNCSEKQLVVD